VGLQLLGLRELLPQRWIATYTSPPPSSSGLGGSDERSRGRGSEAVEVGGVVIIPGGCTKYIQAPDVSWNKPFKQHLGELYDDWLTTDDNKEFTKGGNLKAPSLKLLIDWVKAALALLSADLIKRSFKACALTNATDGSQDDQITCFEQDCPAGRELLTTKAAEMVSVTAEPETTANAGELAASEIPELEMELNMEVDEIYEDDQNDYGIDSSDDDDE